MSEFLYQAFIYLCAAVVLVPLAQRLQLGSVMGYLLAGILIGPALGLVGAETQALQHYAEFGVVMMLFLVGLELEPKALWSMRSRLLGLGGLQVLATTVLVAGGAWLLGLAWQSAVAVGLIFSLSSTAIVLQSLKEKGLFKSPGGQSGFAILLFQDIAFIPMLAFIPLLAIPELMNVAAANNADGHHGLSLVEGLQGWQVVVVNVAAICAVVGGGHFLARPLFGFIAKVRLREVFTAAALLLVVAIALLMTLVGLSPALGAFLAGVVLANSEFRHELEGNIEPFKGLFMGLFFITVGAGVNFTLLVAEFSNILTLTLALVLLKALVLLVLAHLFRLRAADRWLLALGLAQAGEFGFVLLAFAVQSSVLSQQLADNLLLVVALSMLLTPLLFIVLERLLLPRANARSNAREADAITDVGTVIIAGHGRFGQVVNRILLASGYQTVVLDYRAELIDGLRKFGARVFYGDATRPELLHASGLDQAQVFVVAIDDPERAIELVRYVSREAPNIHIVARALDRQHVYKLYQAGARSIVREVFDSSLRAGRYCLEALGMEEGEADRITRSFYKHDRAMLRQLASVWDPEISPFDNKKYIELARLLNAELNDLIAQDRSQLEDAEAKPSTAD